MMTASRPGTILGTAAYMSPEQARGKTVDKRTDIWAFGSVLFEMLTGRKAFPGETVSDTIVSVLSREVDWNALPQGLPPRIRDLLRRCLQRDSAQRLRDIGDARIEIGETLTPGAISPVVTTEPSKTTYRSSILAFAVLLLGILIGVAINRATVTSSTASDIPAGWTGTLLGGPNVAFGPRISPDGKTLAFLAMIDGLTQVAVMNPESGNWTVLTRDRTHGYISRLSWSRDGTRIYFTRHYDVPLGIYSVPALGGEERLILENASGPEALPDGGLLVARINADRKNQIYRYWTGDARMKPLTAIVSGTENIPVRIFTDGARAVFVGQTPDGALTDRSTYLYILDLENEKVARIPVDLAFTGTGIVNSADPITIMPNGQSVLAVNADSDLTKVLRIDLDDPSHVRTVLALQQSPSQIDVALDGSLYVQQSSRPADIVKFSSSGGNLERLNAFRNLRPPPYGVSTATLHTAEGRSLITALIGGRRRLMVADPGKEPLPFVETDEETSGPATLVGNDRVAFMIGSGDTRRIAIASLRDGRIIKRLEDVKAATIRSIIASRDGKTFYFVDSGDVWSIPVDGGSPQKIHNGDGVAITPDGNNLIIQLIEAERIRWLKVTLDGRNEHLSDRAPSAATAESYCL
ncbi:MAG: hypothetical protein E6K60_01520 [Nitrospirae bacterium]|nr:MAG: hypothetical protein E6K60_01520 [Nitrospirota bacterium]